MDHLSTQPGGPLIDPKSPKMWTTYRPYSIHTHEPYISHICLMTDLLPTFLAFFGCRGSKKSENQTGLLSWGFGFFLFIFCFFLFLSFLVLGLGFKRGGVLLIFGAWVVFLVFGVLLVPSLFFLVHFFLLVLGLGFRGGSSYFGDLGGVPGVWGSFGFFLFLSCFFLFFSSSWWPGLVSCVCGFFLSLVVFLCLFFLVHFFFFLVLLVPFLFLFCFFLFLLFLFWGAWVVFLGFWFFLVSFLFVLLVPFLLVWGAWVVFLGFGGSSCSCLVSSCSFSSCFGGLGGFPGVWGVFSAQPRAGNHRFI